jgi:hypothetical protein
MREQPTFAHFDGFGQAANRESLQAFRRSEIHCHVEDLSARLLGLNRMVKDDGPVVWFRLLD